MKLNRITNSFWRLAVEKRLICGTCKTIKKKWLNFWHKVDIAFAKLAWKKMSKTLPVIPNQVMFRTYQDKYTCNPKYLCEQLIKENADCKLVWVCSKKSGDLSQFPPEVTLVKAGKAEYYQALAQSKFWIDNAHNFTWEGFPKKEEQILINLWHGSIGLKRIDPASDSNARRKRAGKLSSKETTYCISNSDFEDMVFRTSYWPNTPFLRYGHTRNDIMFADEEQLKAIKEKVCSALNIDINSKIFLYAPTFRDDPNAIDCFNVDYMRLKSALETRFGGNWVILSRMHMHTQKMLKKKSLIPDFVISADSYDDMQELVAATDIGMTDYSSWICDFVLTGRPGFLFTTDRSSYVTERGFYYPLEDTPFPIAENNDDLIDNILNFDAEAYAAKKKTYLDGLGCTEDGHAAERLAELIQKNIKGE